MGQNRPNWYLFGKAKGLWGVHWGTREVLTHCQITAQPVLLFLFLSSQRIAIEGGNDGTPRSTKVKPEISLD